MVVKELRESGVSLQKMLQLGSGPLPKIYSCEGNEKRSLEL